MSGPSACWTPRRSSGPRGWRCTGSACVPAGAGRDHRVRGRSQGSRCTVRRTRERVYGVAAGRRRRHLPRRTGRVPATARHRPHRRAPGDGSCRPALRDDRPGGLARSTAGGARGGRDRRRPGRVCMEAPQGTEGSPAPGMCGLERGAVMRMRYKLLGQTGLRVSELCLGAMILGDRRGGWGASKEEAARIVERFAEAGGNFVDTANSYAGGESERIVGELVAAERERWVLSTKYTLTMRPDDPNGGGAHRKSLVQSLEASLRRLGTDYLDLYWVHIWDALTPVEEVVRALDDVVRAGKVLYVGISDTPAWIVAQAVTLADLRGWSRFAGLQVPYSLVERSVERELLPMAQALELTVTAWSPLGGGLLTGRYGSDRTRPNDTRVAALGQSGLTDRNLAIADVVNAVAAERGASSAQVAIAWVRAQQAHGVIVPILGARRCRQLEDNLGALELELTAEELARLEEVSRIELGFPHDFGADRLAYGTTRPLIDNHRAYGRGQARRQA